MLWLPAFLCTFPVAYVAGTAGAYRSPARQGVRKKIDLRFAPLRELRVTDNLENNWRARRPAAAGNSRPSGFRRGVRLGGYPAELRARRLEKSLTQPAG